MPKDTLQAFVKLLKDLPSREEFVKAFGSVADRVKRLDDKLTSDFQNLVSTINKKVDEKIASIKPPVDGKDYVLTEADRKEIASKITVPIVEKEIIIKEQPIVTEITKEVPNRDMADDIRNKLELLTGDERLKAEAISGLEALIADIKTLKARPIGTIGGAKGFTLYVNGAKKLLTAQTLNITGSQTTNDMYFDDVAVTDGSTGYPGGSSTVFFSPNAAGDANAWLQTAGGAGSGTNYTLVSELPPDDATSFVQSVTSNAEDLYNFSDSGLHSYDTINALLIKPRFTNNIADATTAFKVEWEAAAAGTKAQTSATIPNSTAWSSDFFLFSTTTTTTGAALTSSVLDSMQSGYIISAAGTNKVEVTNIWGYADYTPGVAPAGGPATACAVFFGDW